MGLGIGVTAPLPRKGARPIPWPALAAQIESAIREDLADPIDQLFIQSDTDEEQPSLTIVIHPGAEPLEFSPHEDTLIAAIAKTSTLGPGYHAHIVHLLNRIGHRCGLAWNWSEEGADETGYATNNDFPALQSAMADFLKYLAGIFGDPAPDSFVMINASLGFQPVGLTGAITPSGPFTFDWLRKAREGKNPFAAARDFFVWWNQPRDAEYWRKTGEMLLWSEVLWHPPAADYEEAPMRQALACLDRARSLDPAAPLPNAEIEELRTLVDWSEDDPPPPPQPGRIGYFRGPMAFTTPGGWSITLPGYFYQEFDEDNEGVLCLSFPGRSVWITAFTTDDPKTPNQMVADFAESHPPPPGASFIEHADGPLIARGHIAEEEDEEEEDGEPFTALRGSAAIPGQIAVITIALDDPNDTDWAIEAFRTLTHPDRDPAAASGDDSDDDADDTSDAESDE